MCLGTTRLMFEGLRVLSLSPTTAALTLGNPVSVRLRTHNLARLAHALIHKPSGTSSSPTVVPSPMKLHQYPPSPPPPPPTTACPLPPTQSRFTPVSAAPARHLALLQCMQPRSLDSALTSQSNPSYPAVHRRALPGRTTVGRSRCASRRRTRCSRRCTHPALRLGGRGRGGLVPRDNTRAGGVWLEPARPTHPSIRPRVPSPESRVARSLSCSRRDAPRARRAPTHPPSEAIGMPRFEKIKNAESGGAEYRAVPCTRGSTAPARSWVLSTPSRSGVCPGAGRGCIAAHRAPSSVIHLHTLAASQRRAHYTRASSTAVLSIGAAAGELSPPQAAAEKISRDGAERSNRWPQVLKQLSSGLDYTDRPTGYLLSTFCASHLHRAGHRRPPASSPACRTFRYPSQIIPPRAAAPGLCPHGVLARPSDPSIPHLDRTARYSRRCVRAAAQRCARGGLGLRDAADGVPSMRDSLYPAPSTLAGARTRTDSLEIFCTTPLLIQFGSEEIGK
ncbi:hypothetical protein B0H14DRAFT_1387844 [Mycena olivaceomarginata]|nr:hypothetical protein B0H14DRAFT_1387844 [Mycena olivaceomarginata]